MTGQFIITKEHRRFTEFADAVRKQHTIGICYGPAGVGKTISARRYAHWDQLEPFLTAWGPRSDSDTAMYATAARARTAFYTPSPLTTPRLLRDELNHITGRVGVCIDEHQRADGRGHADAFALLVELLIIDESERLTATSLELVRDRYDRGGPAVILIGMPGIDKRFSHYPQLYSRLGFAHEYRPLGHSELVFVLTRYWKRLGQALDPDDFTDAQAIAAVQRITRGNFRLLERLFPQIGRVLKINDLTTITNDVIEAAASTLVIGP